MKKEKEATPVEARNNMRSTTTRSEGQRGIVWSTPLLTSTTFRRAALACVTACAAGPVNEFQSCEQNSQSTGLPDCQTFC